MKKYILKIMMIIGSLVVISIPVYAQAEDNDVDAKVIKNLGTEEVKQENGITQEIQSVTIRILEGEYENEEHDVKYVLSENIENQNSKDELLEDNKIRVNIQENDGEISSISIQEITEKKDVFILLFVFLALVLLIGRKKAIKPIIICLLTVLSIYFIFIYSTSKGWNMLLMSFVTVLVVNIIISVILNGIGRKASIVVMSSMLGVAICGLTAFIYFKFTQLPERIWNISIFEFSFNIKELLNSGVVLTSSGICLYLSSIIANYLENLKREDRNINWKQLLKLGIEEGMNHFTNILYIPILLYLCSAITLIFVEISGTIYNETITMILVYLIHIGIGAIVTVPIASVLYSFMNRNKIFFKTKSDNIIEGQRSLKL